MYVCMGMVPGGGCIVSVSPPLRPPPAGLLSPWNPIIMQGTSAAPPPPWAGNGGLVFDGSFIYVPT